MTKKESFVLGSEVELTDLYEVAALCRPVVLSAKNRALMVKCRKELMNLISRGAPIYGINTGFGELSSKRIPLADCRALQTNLVRSHSCGAGDPMTDSQARGILFLRANELSKCHGGVRPEVVETVAKCLNAGLVPFVPSRGSVGASGDLAPSAHAALMLLGEGKAKFMGGEWIAASAALKKAGIKPLVLEEKEGLSLINGTQAMQSVGGLGMLDALKVWSSSVAAAAMTVEALKGTPVPYSEQISALKPHRGQVRTAAILRELFEDSEIRASHLANDTRVQDPYSLRCVPQVHGTVRDALEFASNVVETEMQSVTDNPILIWDEGSEFKNMQVISGGNFHGQGLSSAFDFACSNMVSLGNVCERRVFQLVSDGSKILPPFLAKNPGLESGWMINQYTAAAIASENKTLAHPASSDSIPTSGNREDFVSMGMWAAHKLNMAVRNTAYIVAIELLAGAQGLEFHKPLKPGRGVLRTYEALRSLVPPIGSDKPTSEEIAIIHKAVMDGLFMVL